MMTFKLKQNKDTNIRGKLHENIIRNYRDYGVAGIQTLTEASLNKFINGRDENGYAIISASRDTIYKYNGMLMSKLLKEVASEDTKKYKIDKDSQEAIDFNNRNTKELKDKIFHAGYSFVPVYGGYQEVGSDKASVEKSFIVFPYNHKTREYQDFDKFVQNILEWGSEYEQDSVTIKYPGENPAWYGCNKDTLNNYGKKDTEFTTVKINDITREYFTGLKKWKGQSRKSDFDNGSPQRFTFVEAWMNDYAGTLNGMLYRQMEGELVRR